MSDSLKQQAAQAAIHYIDDNMIIGVGTGSTVHYFIEALGAEKHRIEACVASSKATADRLLALRIPLIDLNAVFELPLYVDGADEVLADGLMIKGGGGAATREKIIGTMAKKFVCIADESKLVKRLGAFPVAVEVLPLARSFVARELVQLGGSPAYREGFVTDNGNIILDVHDLQIQTPLALEESIRLIPGVVDCGLFAKRRADVILLGYQAGVKTLIVS